MLTQSEIDALLAGTIDIESNEGEQRVNLATLMNSPSEHQDQMDSAKHITSYNFWSPDRFSKEQMRAVELIHEDLAERLTTSMPTFLRTNIRPRLSHTEQGRFHEILKDFPENSLFHIIVMAPLPGQAVISLSPNISTLILEQRLGGKIEGKFPERVLTDIDQSLLRGLVEHMLGDIKSAWSKVVNLEPALEDSTTNQHWVQMMMANERVMMLTFEISIQSNTGTMSIFIPFSMLKPVANVLNPHIWISGRREQLPDPTAWGKTLSNLEKAFLSIKVILGEADMTLGEISKLVPGDIIQLNTSITQPLEMQVADQRRFLTRVGRVGNHISVQITGVMDEQLKSSS